MSSFENNKVQRTILVVANETPNTKAVVTMLKRFGYPVSTAEDSKQAQERAAETKPAMIISELVLPDKREAALFDMFHGNSRTADVPLIFLVPPGDAGASTRCLAYGAGCLMKPVQAEDLFHALQGMLELRPRASMRIRTQVPVMVNNIPVGNAGGACDIDLSEAGIRVSIDAPPPVSSRLSLKIQLNDRTVSAEGAVVHAQTPGSGHSGMGLKFINMAPQDRDAIREFIEQEIARPLA